MDLGSIAGMFEPPYGTVVKMIMGMVVFSGSIGSVDFGFMPPSPT